MAEFELELTEPLNCEIAHYYDTRTGDRIISTAGRFSASLGGVSHAFEVPSPTASRALSSFRLSRRALRLDKSNAVFNLAKDGIVVLRGGSFYFYDLKSGSLRQTGHLKQCRNVLHGGIAVTGHGLYAGEYGRNKAREAVPVWRSMDDGRSWQICYEFPAGSIKHVHGVFADPNSDSLWLPTGDFAGECYLAEAKDPGFAAVTMHGDGSQRWRAVTLLFEPDRIICPMDSQLETSHLQVFDRASGRLTEHGAFPGPVWYGKRFQDGTALLQTTVEIGAGVKSRDCHLYHSEDLQEWTSIAQFRKDAWPMRYFKFGVMAFAAGAQTSDDFLLFAEALEGLDGQTWRARIKRR